LNLPKGQRKKERKKDNFFTFIMTSFSNIRINKGSRQPLLAALGCSLLTLFFTTASVTASTPENHTNEGGSPVIKKETVIPKSVAELENILSGSGNNFVYHREGRSDPFMPFISEKVISADVEEIDEEELTGMRLFEPGQLTLVALIFAEDGPLAMVEDSVGKGYMIREGTKIGRTGTVDQINKNTVIIKEPYRTTSGAMKYRTVQMVLKKEGEM
jgi:type IV pilus assembly protein PilP